MYVQITFLPYQVAFRIWVSFFFLNFIHTFKALQILTCIRLPNMGTNLVSFMKCNSHGPVTERHTVIISMGAPGGGGADGLQPPPKPKKPKFKKRIL
jgi:hypothetical protein